MGNLVVVGISDMKIVTGEDVLITYALGSCVGTCIYDSAAGIMGLSHVLLPERSLCTGDNNTKKFADTAIAQMVSDMQARGASAYRMKAKIAGGAQMFFNSTIKIGERNIQMVKRELSRLGISIVGSDVGENYGRTMQCHAADGKVIIKMIDRVITI